MPYILPKEVYAQPIFHPAFEKNRLNVSIVRLDKIHPIISGNKWFKLEGYISEVHENGFTGIATFGGAYSNHIVATAAVCKKENLQCLGFIRGEEPAIYSHTLQEAKRLGMTLCFLSRIDFQSKDLMLLQRQFPGYYFIREGGYGIQGTIGIKNVYRCISDHTQYIVTA